MVDADGNGAQPFWFEDVMPIDWLGQLWIALEVVCGYLMLGGLISIFASKFARRS